MSDTTYAVGKLVGVNKTEVATMVTLRELDSTEPRTVTLVVGPEVAIKRLAIGELLGVDIGAGGGVVAAHTIAKTSRGIAALRDLADDRTRLVEPAGA